MSRQEYIAQWNQLTNYMSTMLGIIAKRLCQSGKEVDWKEMPRKHV